MPQQPVILELVEGDLLPFLDFEWEDSGSVVGFDFKLHVRLEDGSRFTRTGFIDDDGSTGNNATFHFEWQVGDLVRGRHDAELEVFDDLGRNETWKGIVLDVSKDFL